MTEYRDWREKPLKFVNSINTQMKAKKQGLGTVTSCFEKPSCVFDVPIMQPTHHM